MTIELTILISVVSVSFALIFGLSNLRRNNKADDKSDATQLTTVIVKLENIGGLCSEIKGEVSTLRAEVKELSERLVIVEQSTKSAHRRIDELIKK